MLLQGQVALITGAGRGIGRSIALGFAQEGATVAVTGRTRERLDRVAAEIAASGGDARPYTMDVSRDSDVAEATGRILSEYGQIDILVNNAGIDSGGKTPVWAITLEQWDSIMNTNLRGMFLCCQAVIPSMMEKGRGVIINIGSSSGRRADDSYGPYAASKWGVVGYTASLAASLRPHGVRVNGINPGWVDTDMSRALDPKGSPEWSTPEEIADAALFLATAAPRDMTGQFIDVFSS